ncbi:uncharacterized protein At1g08160 [Amaranthus tricolor]|uniref:uncharacterized protein At1g08160 n=1 Tax=Amaranthus tricolor TaxID=29722 RepID=UPI002587213B|nr:uncharacterized protein At1g08160 [Amaranthus tricolor]
MSNLSEITQSLPLPPQRHPKTQTPPSQFSISKNYSPAHFIRLPRDHTSDHHLLHHPRRTHPLVWCSAIICLVICLLIIVFGITTLIIFLVIKPKYPSFDIPNANLNVIYFDSPDNFNGDFTFVANFTNPNRKIHIKFDFLDVELYFIDRLIAAQALEPFSLKPREARLEMIHFISSLVYLPPNPAIELQRQVQSNRVKYNVRGTFRVRAKVGMAQFSYWLHANCQLEMTSPPTGVLVARNCTTKR